MKAWMPLVLMVLCSSAVLGVGMGVPDSLKGTQKIDADDTNTLYADVILFGGEQDVDITFFMEVNATGLNVNGKNPRYDSEFTLGDYESETVSMALKGLKDGTYLVTWGVIEHGDGNGLLMDSRVDKQTTVVVKNAGSGSSSSSSSSSSGRGGGGGGSGGSGGLYMNVTPAVSPSPSSNSGDGVVMQDVQSETGVSTAVLPAASDELSNEGSASVSPGSNIVGASPAEMGGRVILIMVIALSMAAMVSSAYVVAKEKRGEQR